MSYVRWIQREVSLEIIISDSNHLATDKINCLRKNICLFMVVYQLGDLVRLCQYQEKENKNFHNFSYFQRILFFKLSIFGLSYCV